MEIYQGKSVLNGIAIGRIAYFSRNEQAVKRKKISDFEGEIKRFLDARKEAHKELQALYEKALVEVGEVHAMIFQTHQMMLEDEDYNDSVYNMIRHDHVNAEFAVATTGENFSRMFLAMNDEYFRARAADVKEISERVISALTGVACESNLTEPVILLAEDLAPGETVRLDKTKLLAFVTQSGSVHSHTAILARTMNIPALIGIRTDPAWHGRMAVVDGREGKLIIDPDYNVFKNYISKQQKDEERKRLLEELKGLQDQTKDGRKIRLYANIGSVADVAGVLENDAAGIGLFRSEFLYLEKDHYPTEEEQFFSYRTVVQNMAGKKVIIRTLDIGADKQASYFQLDQEENPAMGYRAIRICLDRPEIFRTQLRAIYRASAYGSVGVMFPMIISVQEICQIKKICREVRHELEEEGMHCGDVECGVMIETPAAVMISDRLAKEVDFFSIGTNDLTQYTLAIDRQNPRLDQFYDARHPAVLQMIRMVIDNGHRGGCWVGICGDVACDPEMTQTFLKMGIDELSVPAAAVLPLRQIIRNTQADHGK